MPKKGRPFKAKKVKGSKSSKHEDEDESEIQREDEDINKEQATVQEEDSQCTASDGNASTEKKSEQINNNSNNNDDNDKKQNGIVKVDYCKVCKLPIEYCEFVETWPECQKYLAEAFPEKLKELIELKENDQNKKNKKVNVGKKDDHGKIKDDAKINVHITSRSKRKFVTLVTGLEQFGFDVKNTAKALSKKFACGASAVKEPAIGVEIQGDVKEQLLQFLQDNNIDEERIKVIDDKNKKKKKQAPLPPPQESKTAIPDSGN